MIVTYDDIFTEKDIILAHGCNTGGIFGAGIAKVIKDKYHHAYKESKKLCDMHESDELLGHTQLVYIDENVTVANCYTQVNTSKNVSNGFSVDKMASYDAVDACFKQLSLESNVLKKDVHFPMIGCGLGGLQKNVVYRIMEHHFPDDNGVLHLLRS